MAFRPARMNMRILKLMYVMDGPMCGTDFFRDHGAIKRGTIYKTLKRLEGQGLLYSWIEGRRLGTNGSRRRLYTLTAKGRQTVTRGTKFQRVETVVHPLFS